MAADVGQVVTRRAAPAAGRRLTAATVVMVARGDETTERRESESRDEGDREESLHALDRSTAFVDDAMCDIGVGVPRDTCAHVEAFRHGRDVRQSGDLPITEGAHVETPAPGIEYGRFCRMIWYCPVILSTVRTVELSVPCEFCVVTKT